MHISPMKKIINRNIEKVIEQAKLTSLPLVKVLKKQEKIIKKLEENQIEALREHDEKQIKALKALEPQDPIKKHAK